MESAKKKQNRKRNDKFNSASTSMLLYMVKEGSLDEIQRYFNEGNDVTLPDYDERTALHIASAEGHYGIVVFLLSTCRVNIDAKDRWGRTALDDAVYFGRKRVEEFLRSYNYPEKHVEIDTADIPCSTEIQQSHKKRKRDRSKDASLLPNDPGGTSEDLKQIKRDRSTDASLLPNDPDGTSEDFKHWTSVLMNFAHEDDLNSLKRHVEDHIDWLNKPDYDDRTVLHVAAADGRVDIVSFLMELNMDLNAKDRWGNTPYMEAARIKNTEIMNVLKNYMTEDELAKVNVPSEAQLYQVARNIGKEWEILGLRLGVSRANIDHIKMDNDTAVCKIGSMLVSWRRQYYHEATFENLYAAMQSVGISREDACEWLTF